MVTKQEELIYHAFRNPSLREQEREEIERKTQEFLKWKRNKIQVIPFGVSGEQEYQPPRSAHSAKIAIDIAGQKFGKLTAIKRCQTRDMASYWVFQCECGYTGTYERHKVMDGSRTSCDACKKIVEKPKSRTPDLVGKRYGNLTVMQKAEKSNKAGTQWVCKCDCGAVVNHRGFDLEQGRIKKCGLCRRKVERAKRKRQWEEENAKRAQDKAQRSNNKRVLAVVQSGDAIQSDRKADKRAVLESGGVAATKEPRSA